MPPEALSSPALASHRHSGRLRLCRLCRRQPSLPTITAGGSGFIVFVVASPRLSLSQWAAQALSSLSSPALASHYHSGRLRLCRLCRRQPSPLTGTAGGSGFVVFVVASPRFPLSQRAAQALSSLSSPALASHYHSGRLRLCRLGRRQPSRFPLSQRAAQALSSLSSPALASHWHSGRLRLCRLCRRQPSLPTITAGGSGFVVFVVASPRFPLSQRAAQALSSLSSLALASHWHSGRLRLCRLCRRQPSLPTITAGGSGFVVFVVASPRFPLSQRAAQALSSLSSPVLASHYHSGRLRLCRLCRRQPSLPTITAGGSGFVVFVVASPLASHCHSGRLRLCRLCHRNFLPLSQWAAADCTQMTSAGLNPQTEH